MKSKEENTKKNNLRFFTKNLDIFILIGVTAIGMLLASVKGFQNLDYRFYDLMLGWSSEVEQDPNIVLVDIDDRSLNELGSWPWTRDILANVLIRMKELGAKNAVFDIEYLSESNLAPNSNIGQITESTFSEGESAISRSISSFADMISSREIPLRDVGEASSRLLENSVDPVLFDMYRKITDGLYQDNDLYFGQAIQFLGSASLTINTRDISIDTPEEDREYAERRFLFENVTDSRNLINHENEYSATEEERERGFTPALHKIISFANGAGFTNVVVDADGARRRVELLNFRNGKYTGQLAFAPLAKSLDVQSMERKNRQLILYGVKLPGSEDRTDITIPLDMNGRMIVNWLHTSYEESFKHVPVYNFHYLDFDEKQVVNDLYALYSADTSGISESDSAYLAYALDVLQEYNDAETMRAVMLSRCRGYDIDGNAIGGGLADEDYEMYFAARNAFFDDAEALANLCAQIDGSTSIPEIAMLQESIAIYKEDFAAMKAQLQDSFCLIGNSATASTDLGVTPFARRYPNMGTHANVVNTILQRDFISEVNSLWVITATFIFALAVILFARKHSHGMRNILGLIYVIIPLTVTTLLFTMLRIYIPAMALVFMVLVTYLAELALNFVMTNADKNTLRRGFDAYVAPEVVSEIVKNPGLLGLGGMNKRMTALFSDVQKFSAFTEQINKAEGESHGAVRLVEILNGYLGVLSDAIMECRGTIDKYVGDEIVAFFGAPIDNPNNAFDSCVAGIRMKQAEDRYNEEHLHDLPPHPVTGEPFLLKSRVGCNTGDMVVGNMGTAKKLNYTIMGNNVNLASRLEGTNKEYDSWIIASESTWLEANSGENEGKIIARQLDCVRVINVEKPVQIYSIVGLRNELTSEEIEAAEIFNQGMEWYLKGRETPEAPKDLNDLKRAVEYFERAYKCLEPRRMAVKDFISPEKKMALRCQNYLKNGLPTDKDGKLLPWNGVFTMATK